MPTLSRRECLKLLPMLGLGPLCAGDWGAPPPMPRNPEKIGTLKPEEVSRLWRIFQHVGKRSDTADFNRLQRKEFAEILHLKTGRPPSYFDEYKAALALEARYRGELGEEAGLEALFQHDDKRLRDNVLVEFGTLHLMHGGYRAFGWGNVRGNIGGSFSPPAPLPYRGYRS